jgi:hypothetical protein
VQPNETLLLTRARSKEAIAIAAYVDAGASAVVSRMLSWPLAAELGR